MEYNIVDLEERYELELGRVVSEIEKSRAKSVLLQLPDGLKPWGPGIVDYLEDKINRQGDGKVEISIWLGACFGACDLPNSDADLVVQFGHAAWT
jgi:diphthamide biosynthesis enzyme Dph1/Dph2-like protein